jgi:hypothetical protein
LTASKTAAEKKPAQKPMVLRESQRQALAFQNVEGMRLRRALAEVEEAMRAVVAEAEDDLGLERGTLANMRVDLQTGAVEEVGENSDSR